MGIKYKITASERNMNDFHDIHFVYVFPNSFWSLQQIYVIQLQIGFAADV